ncbi:hypothetical protein F5Y04DRAFT_196929 [Hypomontagnella monticulosa]|nr:hypothetical protein F5Y04DRAFT_196929 [Hypomontagnella monticulosa]
MADQCIVCLENLDVQSPPSPSQLDISPEDALPQPTTAITVNAPTKLSPNSPPNNITDVADHNGEDSNIAVIQVCGHALHDACLREWTGKANSCPICRQAFHLVHVFDKIGGTQLSSYKVEDKKQVVEFDPQAWLDDNPEIEEDSRPCPICEQSDREDLLLLCDSCDAPYHTYCVGLETVPRGHWFCMECRDTGAELLAAELRDPDTPPSFSETRSSYLPRTQATVRRARQQARSNDWQGAWGQIAGRVWGALGLDLDNHDDDDEALQGFRRSQQQSERERREYQRWQQRFSIASRLGAREVFTHSLSNVLPQPIVRRQQTPPPPPQETREEKKAWGALEKAMDAINTSSPSNHRKRKSRSVTASPVEPPQQQERKLKRPRTRRAPTISEASTSQRPAPTTYDGIGVTVASPPPSTEGAPSFLNSLLKEVEMSAPSDDENARTLFTFSKPMPDPSSPASSPSPSAYSSPRALSTTPPPRAIHDRPGSPLTLSSHIEPIYPRANFLGSRSNSDNSDSESKPHPQRRRHHHHHHHRHNHRTHRANSGSPEIQQPRPQRQQSPTINQYLSGSSEGSSRPVLPFQMKESISGIVKNALKPHWKSGHITADQYASINRDLSHKLYKEVSDESLNDEARQRFEKIATSEVARAVADLKA